MTSLTSKSLVPVGLRVLKKGQRFIDDLEPVRGRVALDGRRRVRHESRRLLRTILVLCEPKVCRAVRSSLYSGRRDPVRSLGVLRHDCRRRTDAAVTLRPAMQSEAVAALAGLRGRPWPKEAQVSRLDEQVRADPTIFYSAEAERMARVQKNLVIIEYVELFVIVATAAAAVSLKAAAGTCRYCARSLDQCLPSACLRSSR